MYPDDRSPLYLCTEDERAEILKDIGLTETSMREGVDSVMDWFYKQPHLPKAGIYRIMVEVLILTSKGSIERVKEKINNFYKWRLMEPELINSRVTILDNLDTAWANYCIVPLPKLRENRRVFIIKFGPDVTNFDLVEFFKSIIILLDFRLKFDYMISDIWILDMKHVGWAQVLAQNPLVLKKMNQLLTKGVKWRLFGIHVINYNTAVSAQRVIDFFKLFFSSVVLSRIVFHHSLEDVYKYVPKECLPEDYGGNEQSLRKLKEALINELRRPHVVEYLLDCCKLVSDESLRPQDDNSEDFLSGSFRKLELD